MARQLAGKGEDQVADEEAANTKKLKSGKIQVMALLDGAGGNRQKIWLKVGPCLWLWNCRINLFEGEVGGEA